jgi:purine-cytosine permease-like protein
MDKIISRCALLIMGLLCATASFAQEQQPEMADVMRSNGKIYVVVGVGLIILIGLFLYVWNIDRKIKKMERGIS